MTLMAPNSIATSITPEKFKRIAWRANPLKGLYRRRFQVYCIGAAKTGTTSVAGLFEREYLAAHEPETRQTVRTAIAYLEGSCDRASLQDGLLKRDRRLSLEVESAHPLGYLCDLLEETFPTAKFIITLRKPHSWLASRLNYHLNANPPEWQEYRDYFWTQQHTTYFSEERILEQHGICSLDTYLAQYADHYDRVLAAIPTNRRLIIKTHELSQSLGAIAAFLEIPTHTLHRSHSKQSPNKVNLLDRMDPDFVRAKIWHHCQSLIEEYFPEFIHQYRA